MKFTWHLNLDGEHYEVFTRGNDIVVVVGEGKSQMEHVNHLARALVPFQLGQHTGQISEGTWLHMWMNRRLYVDGYDAVTGDPLPAPVNRACVGAVSGLLGFLFGLLILVPMLICMCVCCIVHRNDVYHIDELAAPKTAHSEPTKLITEPVAHEKEPLLEV